MSAFRYGVEHGGQARHLSHDLFLSQLLLHELGLFTSYALEIQHIDGSITPVLYSASVYKDESGDVIDVFAIARDITEHKKAEEMLKSKLKEVTHLNEKLEQFAYVSSHDLQKPLRMITSYLHLLPSKYQGNLDEKTNN